MLDLNFFNQCYQNICSQPDFPAEKAAELWRHLPRGSRDLAARIYLLPGACPWSDREIAYATVLMLLTLSSFVHDELERNRAFGDGEAVLYGDYLFALAYSFLPEQLSEEEGRRLTESTCAFCEGRLGHRRRPLDPQEAWRCAERDYGARLEDIAAEAVKGSSLSEEEGRRYVFCAKKLGTVWGILCEGVSLDIGPQVAEIRAIGATLPMKEEIEDIIEKWEDVAVENRR